MEREAFNYKGIKFSLSFVTANGKPASRLNYQWRGKYIRKTFQNDTTGAEARKFAKRFVDSKNIGFDGLEDLSPEVIADIKQALAILPAGQSLTKIVQDSIMYNSTYDMRQLALEFVETKKRASRSKSHIKHCKGFLKKVCNTFESFEKASPTAIIDFLSSYNAPKTRSNYGGTLADFFSFALRKNAITHNPFDKISKSDYGGGKSDKIPEIASISQTCELLAYLRQYRPKFVKHFVLALFAGVRIEECGRLTNELIDIPAREISFPKKIVKGQIKAFILGDFPDVLWQWLRELEHAPIIRPNNMLRTALGYAIELPANFARHSFATYHLSLYRDFHRTAKLTRHLSISTLENNYVGSMVKKYIAEDFFALTPSAIDKWTTNNAKRLEDIAQAVKIHLANSRKKKTL